MQYSQQQRFNHAIIQLAVLLYQIDGRVTLTEQDYLDELVESLSWESPISKSAFVNDVIHKTRQATDAGEQLDYVRALQEDLNFNAEKVVEVAMAITGVDGERSESEAEILSLLTHKLLAKSLVASAVEPVASE